MNKQLDQSDIRATIEAIVKLQHTSKEAQEVFQALMDSTLETATQYARLTVANTNYEALLMHHRDSFIRNSSRR